MDTPIRHRDEILNAQLKAHAALTGRIIGDLINEAIQCYLAGSPSASIKRDTLRKVTPENYPQGCERISEAIDSIVYGN